MGCYSGRVIKKELTSENEIRYSEKCGQCVFSECRNIKPRSLYIDAKQTKRNWQVDFFDADEEVYFDRIIIGSNACFSSIIRNYWWNGKEGEEKKEGYYSLIKSVKELFIYKEHLNDLLDYAEGRYEAGEHWQLHKLDKNIELEIDSGLQETIVKRLSKYFDNIWCDNILADLKTVNNITCSCDWYEFKNCEGIVPQKLIINASVKEIDFDDADSEVHIPEVVMEEKADLKSIIRNDCVNNKYYSILPYVQTLVIRNNPEVLYDLMNYINRRYKIKNNYGNWQIDELNKNMKIMIERPGIVFGVIKRMSNYFADVLVDNNNPKEYFAKQQLYQKQFQEHFARYDLETNQIGNLILATQEPWLKGRKLNVGNSSKKMNQLYVNQKLAPQQFVCFHNTDKPVIIDTIVIKNNGNLRSVLQNAYYNGVDSGFFSLLRTVKELEIRSNHTRDNQVLLDLMDYIEGKYILNPNWKREQLDKDMIIVIKSDEYSLFLNAARKLRKYFRYVSINRIYTLLEAENVINQEYENKCVFVDSMEVNPQKLVVNVKLTDGWSLILFNNADGEVCIPEITIGEHGSFDAIVRNYWHNRKDGSERKQGYYSLVSYVETLTIQNNPQAVCDLDSYVSGNYKMQDNKCKVQKLSKNIAVRINGVSGLDEQVNRLKDYFDYIVINGRKSLRDNRQQMLTHINVKSSDIRQRQAQNNQKQQNIDNSVASIQDANQRIERARARLGRRRARFREYLALAE